MNFDRALAIFEHSLNHDPRENTAISLALLKLVDQEVIETASREVSQALALGQRVWLTSDLHLGHANIIGYCDRPFHDTESMDAALLQLLGKVVPGELLVIVGDIALGKFGEAMALLKSMPGRKILVAGNHDFERSGKPRFLRDQDVFEAVVPFLYWTGPQGRGVLVSHHPVGCPAHLTTARALLNYHGHLHQQVLAPTENVKYMNVGWDVDYALRCL
ncbi:MAG: metallophosphoesterase [Rhodoferax sp.]